MGRKDNDETRNNKSRKEPSLKDALLPPTSAGGDGDEKSPPAPRRTSGPGAPSLQDALLPADHKPQPVPQSGAPVDPDPPAAPKRRPAAPSPGPGNVVPAIVGVAIVVGFIVVFALGRMSATRDAALPSGQSGTVADTAQETPPAEASEAPAAPEPSYDDPGPMGLAEIQEKGLIVDVHEHIESMEEAPKFLAVMDAMGVQTVCLMGTSKFTLTLNESYGFTEYDENNEELIKIINAWPGRFEAWPTVNPEDPEKLAKIQDLVARGATGVKLYIGHGYVTRDHRYMFHTRAIDDAEMLPLYAWCEENYIPIVLHVNPFREKKGFAQEFIAVLTQYPDLKVVAPHFILSSVSSYRLREFLDTFPNLYSDISFGDYFMKERLSYISKYPKKFQKILGDYPDRFMFATDLVMIKGRPDDWAPTQFQAYIDMLTKTTYTSPAIPGETLNGLALSDELVSRILFRNYGYFRASRPSGTRITRAIEWERMSQDPVDREPGEAFPPLPK